MPRDASTATAAISQPRILQLAVILALAVHGVVLVRTAWVHDDAFITMRTVSNVLDGYGLTYNAGERVQTYTHPLWMLLLTGVYRLTREPFFTIIALGGFLSLCALSIVAMKLAQSPAQALVVIMLATASKALTDYSTSGLENPLVHLLLVLFVATLLDRSRPRMGRLAFLAGLLVWTRPDTGLLVAPSLAAAFRNAGPRRVLRSLVGILPWGAWMVFQLWYYGFPFPNTAYAKLGAGIPVFAVLERGVWYLWNSLTWDPLTLLAIAGGFVVACRTRKTALGIGMVLYLGYVVRAGGDFMSGRFLTPPFFLALILLARHRIPRLRPLLVFVLVLAAGLANPRSPLLSGRSYGKDPGLAVRGVGGIGDERAYFYPSWGLLNVPPDTPFERQHRSAGEAPLPFRRVMWRKGVGFFGFFHAGPRDYVVDAFSLTSPLLAHLPVHRGQPWLVGHLKRQIPSGYFESLVTGENLLLDENLRQFYHKLRILTEGDLDSTLRLVEIFRMNAGVYRRLITQPLHYDVPIGLLARVQPPATPWDAVWECPVDVGGSVRLLLDGPSHAAEMGISLDGGDRYEITLLHNYDDVWSTVVHTPGLAGTPVDARLQIPVPVREEGFEMVRIAPLDGDGVYAVSDVHLTE